MPASVKVMPTPEDPPPPVLPDPPVESPPPVLVKPFPLPLLPA